MPVYRAAVIGLGRMGSTFDDEMAEGGTLFKPYCHGPTYYYSTQTDLVAGADLHDEQRAIFGKRWGLSSTHLYSDYKQMLAKERPDIVSVCTTARHRASIVQDVARAGVKAIWAEKPISLSLEEADSMVRVCREEGVTLAVNCARRWNPFYTQARDILQSGELGRILHVTAHAACGLSSNGSHLLDTVRYLAGGDVQWVTGEMVSDEVAAGDDDPMGNGYLAFDNGARAFVRSMPCGEATGWDISVLAEKGFFRLRESGSDRWEMTRLGTESPFGKVFSDGTPKLQSPRPVSYTLPLPPKVDGTGITTLADIISAMETGRPPRCSGEDALKALETAIAMRESHRRGGGKVHLPLKDRSLKILSSEIREDAVPARIRRLRAAESRAKAGRT